MMATGRPVHLAITAALPIAVLSTAAFTPASAETVGDPAAGKTTFARCAVCHSVTPGQNKLGPSLAGVVGRKAGSYPNFAYSPQMKGSNITWTKAELDAYLANPRTKVPGTKMFFMGLPNPQDRANVIAYLAKPQ